MQIEGLRAMFVGGGSGFARATARRVAAGGGTVAILDRDEAAGAAVADELGGFFVACDSTDFAGAERAIERAVEQLGGLDAAVNTAGGGVRAQRTLTREGPHSLDDFRAVIDLNLVGTFNLNRLQAHHMSTNQPNDDGERGVIVNTASIAAYEGQIGQVAYAAAKAGIAGMALTMARDLGSLGIRVNAIAPSLFDTGGAKKLSDELRAELTKDAAFPRRLGDADEYAQLAIAIVNNPMLNGGTIRLDAGQRFGPR